MDYCTDCALKGNALIVNPGEILLSAGINMYRRDERRAAATRTKDARAARREVFCSG